MTSEPLDPCPVCGHNTELDAGNQIVVCTLWDCPYQASPKSHRRLCAEVALARVVMADFAVAVESESIEARIAARQRISEAAGRVREASK